MIRIDVWSDVACPWCWVGKRHLERAVESFAAPVEVLWHAFELDPSAPAEAAGDLTYAQRLAAKYGVPEAEGQAMIDRMTETGRGVGVEFRFDRVRPTNTFAAHRLLHWARGAGRQTELKEQLLQAYMSDGELLSDPDVLARRAAAAGLDREAARRVVVEDAFADEVRADEAQAFQLMIRGVPFFVFGQRYAVSGAMPADVLEEALRRVAAEGEPSGVEASAAKADGAACAIDGDPSACG